MKCTQLMPDGQPCGARVSSLGTSYINRGVEYSRCRCKAGHKRTLHLRDGVAVQGPACGPKLSPNPKSRECSARVTVAKYAAIVAKWGSFQKAVDSLDARVIGDNIS